MGSFVLDFSGYNALLSSDNYSRSYYGADDPFPGSDPNHPLHSIAGRRQLGHANQHRYADRNSIARLDAEKAMQERRKQLISNFGSTWLKPPGVSKTLFQIREELREQEEQAEAERREELAQQLAQAEAEAAAMASAAAAEAMEAEEGGAEGMGLSNSQGSGVEPGGDLDAPSGGEQDLDDEIPDADAEGFSFGGDNDDQSDDPFASTSEEDDDDDEDQEDDDADHDDDADEDNDDGDDDDASNRGVDSAASIDLGGRDGREGRPAGARRSDVAFDGPAAATPAIPATPVTPANAIAAMATLEEQREQARARAAERREMRQMRATEDRVRAMLARPRLSAIGGLYGHDDEDIDEEDEEQMLQEDDLVREPAGRAGGGAGRNGSRRSRFPPGNVNDGNANNSGINGRGHNHSTNRNSHRSMVRGSFGASMGDDEGLESEEGDNFPDQYTTDAEGMDMDMDMDLDMDADLDDDIPDADAGVVPAMDLSAALDGSYEHTDTEAELSSSIGHDAHGVGVSGHLQNRRHGGSDDEADDDGVGDEEARYRHRSSGGGGDGVDDRVDDELDDDDDTGHDVGDDEDDDDIPHHSFLAAATASALGLGGSAAGRSSLLSVGGGGLIGTTPRAGAGGNLARASLSSNAATARFRNSLARSDRNSLDISGLLSRDGSGSSNIGSSPQLRRI